MRWQRTVVFEVEADSLEDALSVYEEDGPECASRVELIDTSDFYAVEKEETSK